MSTEKSKKKSIKKSCYLIEKRKIINVNLYHHILRDISKGPMRTLTLFIKLSAKAKIYVRVNIKSRYNLDFCLCVKIVKI